MSYDAGSSFPDGGLNSRRSSMAALDEQLDQWRAAFGGPVEQPRRLPARVSSVPTTKSIALPSRSKSDNERFYSSRITNPSKKARLKSPVMRMFQSW